MTNTLEELARSCEEAYRTRDASGSPTDAETVGLNWIGEVAEYARHNLDPTPFEMRGSAVEGGGRVERLYVGTRLLAVATTFRDDMNFTVLVRWLSPELCAAGLRATAKAKE